MELAKKNVTSRGRATRACDTCHQRKIRCNIVSRGIPCTNCVDFANECVPHIPKKRTRSKKQKKRTSSDCDNEENAVASSSSGLGCCVSELPQGMRDQIAPVEYLGGSLGLSLLRNQCKVDALNHPLIVEHRLMGPQLDPAEAANLYNQGAFLIPERQLCDDLVETFFEWVAPIVPVVNRSGFMHQYNDPANPPSLLLFQAILLAASKVSRNPQLLVSGVPNPSVSTAFYKRAKALYDAGYERDRIATVQALTLIGWYCTDPKNVSNISYCSRVAVAVAQSIGMHRSVENSSLSTSEKRLHRRIWWTLFSRDRLVAVGMGRPLAINLADCDVEMICESDFIEEEYNRPTVYAFDTVQVQFFVQYCRLCKIMGQVVAAYYTATSDTEQSGSGELLGYDSLLTEWRRDLPPEVVWERSNHNFWATLLHSHYCTTICLLHRTHMSSLVLQKGGELQKTSDRSYNAQLSSEAAYDAANGITDAVEALQSWSQLRYAPPFFIYSLFSAILVHVYRIQVDTHPNGIPIMNQVNICLFALDAMSGSWTSAKTVFLLFYYLLQEESQSIRGGLLIPEPLQAGETHQTNHKGGSSCTLRGNPHVLSEYSPWDYSADFSMQPLLPDMSQAMEFSDMVDSVFASPSLGGYAPLGPVQM